MHRNWLTLTPIAWALHELSNDLNDLFNGVTLNNLYDSNSPSRSCAVFPLALGTVPFCSNLYTV